MRQLTRVFGLAVALVAGTVAIHDAYAMSEKTRNILGHIGQVSAAPKICSQAEVDDEKLALLVIMAGIDLKRPEYFMAIQEKMNETIAAFQGNSDDVGCAAVFLLYGPSGQNVPGLVRRK